MAYIADLDPNSIVNERAEAYSEYWDQREPMWHELSLPVELQPTVDYNSVEDPESGYVRRYGSDDPGRYFPGASGE